MIFKKTLSIFAVFAGFLLLVKPADAHVVVKPSEVGIGERVNFVVSVPTEEDTPTVSLRLIIPEEIKSVRPNVKPGWKIQMIKTGTGENERVSEIIWSGGQIPKDMRDEFVFSSQAPAKEATLDWKAYQTYQSGTVVSWDKNPSEIEEYEKNHSSTGNEEDPNAPAPFSVTQVVDDLKSNEETVRKTQDNSLIQIGVVFSLILSSVSLWMQMRKKK